MEVKFVSLFVHEEQNGFLYQGINKKTTGFLFDNKEDALEHQESFDFGLKVAGVHVLFVD